MGDLEKEVRRQCVWRWLWGFTTSEEFTAYVSQHFKRKIKEVFRHLNLGPGK